MDQSIAKATRLQRCTGRLGTETPESMSRPQRKRTLLAPGTSKTPTPTSSVGNSLSTLEKLTQECENISSRLVLKRKSQTENETYWSSVLGVSGEQPKRRSCRARTARKFTEPRAVTLEPSSATTNNRLDTHAAPVERINATKVKMTATQTSSVYQHLWGGDSFSGHWTPTCA